MEQRQLRQGRARVASQQQGGRARARARHPGAMVRAKSGSMFARDGGARDNARLSIEIVGQGVRAYALTEQKLGRTHKGR